MSASPGHLPIETFGDFDRAAGLQNRIFTRKRHRAVGVRGLDQAVTAHRVGAAVVFHAPADQQASLAFDQSSIGKRVARFDEIPLQSLLQHFAGEAIARVLPPWTQEFRAADLRAHGQLSRTPQAFAQQDMNLLRTAKQLRIHPNTGYARFRRIETVSGLDPRSFRGRGELLIAAGSYDRETAPG